MTASMFTNSTVTHNVYCLAVQVIPMATYAALFFQTASQNSVHGECTEAPPSVQMSTYFMHCACYYVSTDSIDSKTDCMSRELHKQFPYLHVFVP